MSGFVSGWDYDNAPTDPRTGGKLTAAMAVDRIAELEGIVRSQMAMIQAISAEAGLRVGEQFSAKSVVAAIERKLLSAREPSRG